MLCHGLVKPCPPYTLDRGVQTLVCRRVQRVVGCLPSPPLVRRQESPRRLRDKARDDAPAEVVEPAMLLGGHVRDVGGVEPEQQTQSDQRLVHALHHAHKVILGQHLAHPPLQFRRVLHSLRLLRGPERGGHRARAYVSRHESPVAAPARSVPELATNVLVGRLVPAPRHAEVEDHADGPRRRVTHKRPQHGPSPVASSERLP
mmetsp:Transcript_7158/g.14367  ORF Transcript_7158/g.14367 Transcript_7158/m.14367 type:complete len:203 (+) Transcript_7158:208-816(+)